MLPFKFIQEKTTRLYTQYKAVFSRKAFAFLAVGCATGRIYSITFSTIWDLKWVKSLIYTTAAFINVSQGLTNLEWNFQLKLMNNKRSYYYMQPCTSIILDMKLLAYAEALDEKNNKND